jgi:hypothetical protein
VFLAVEDSDFFHKRVRRLRRIPQMRREQICVKSADDP